MNIGTNVRGAAGGAAWAQHHEYRDAVLAGSVMLVAMVGSLLVGEPMLAVGLSLMPLALLVVATRPLLLGLIFISFAYFRLQDCYVPLAALKIPLVSAAGAILGFGWRSFMEVDDKTTDRRLELRWVTLIVALFTLAIVSALSPNQIAVFNPELRFASITVTVTAMTVLLALWHIYLAPRDQPFWSNELTLFCLFFALVAVSTVMGSDPQHSFQYWGGNWWKIAVMTLAIATLLRREEDFALTARFIVASGIIVALATLKNKLEGNYVEGSRVIIATAAGSVLGDPNDLALILLFPLGFALVMIVYRPSWFDALLGMTAVPLLLVAIVFTQSRGGLIAVLVVMAVVGRKVLRSWVVVGAIGFVVAIGLYYAMGIDQRVSGGAAELAVSVSGLDKSSEQRLMVWQAAFDMAVAYPLTGIGMDNFRSRLIEFAPDWRGPPLVAHSTWFSVMAATGFSGFIVFMLMVLATLKSAVNSLRYFAVNGEEKMMSAMALALTAGLLGFCAAGTFLAQGFGWPLYILLALTCALARYRLRRASNTA